MIENNKPNNDTRACQCWVVLHQTMDERINPTNASGTEITNTRQLAILRNPSDIPSMHMTVNGVFSSDGGIIFLSVN